METSRSLSLQKWDCKDKGIMLQNTREGEGHADEGWFIDKHVMSNMCTAFSDFFF